MRDRVKESLGYLINTHLLLPNTVAPCCCAESPGCRKEQKSAHLGSGTPPRRETTKTVENGFLSARRYVLTVGFRHPFGMSPETVILIEA